MKYVTLLLTIVAFVQVPCRAQSTQATAKLPNAALSLAGVSGPTIEIRQIQEQPVVRVGLAQVQLASFDFAWTIKTKSGGSEYEGPYPNSGSKLNATIMTDLLKDAAKGIVTRIYIDDVSASGADGVIRKYADAAYKVKP